MPRERKLRQRRRGLGTVEWIIVAGFVVLAIVAGVARMGPSVRTQLNGTASNAGDPTQLAHQYGAQSAP